MQTAEQILDKLRAEDNLRQLRTIEKHGRMVVIDGKKYIDLSSNDYLGLSGDVELQKEFLDAVDTSRFLLSNPSSRLITGNSVHYDTLESAIESLYAGKRALVLGSGYAVNNGALSALTGKDDLIIADKLVHASIIDGLRLCVARWTRFAHNDMSHLESLLKKSEGAYENVWVVTESLFSMDGDFAPLKELVELKHKYGFRIYLDEAHAFGCVGAKGEGLAVQEGIADEVDVLIATLGKAAASCGAFIVTDSTSRELLVNRMRTLIFSTALPPLNLMWSAFVVERLAGMNDRREHLWDISQRLGGGSYIIPMITGSNRTALDAAQILRDNGFWATAIRMPTVPRGEERVRISLSAALKNGDVEKLAELCRHIG